MDQLRAMRLFATIAETGSLSAAARKTGQPLTTVSRLLAALEDRVGVGLVSRTTRKLVLTAEGHDYLATCNRVLEDIDTAESRIAGKGKNLSGEIGLTAPVVFGRLHVLPVIGQFLNDHAGVSARMRLADSIVDLTDEGIDVAVRIGELPDSSLKAIRVGSLKMLTCVSPEYARENRKIKVPADLTDHAGIAFPQIAAGGKWRFRSRTHGSLSVRPRVRLTVDTAESAIDAAIAGLGITRVLSYQAVAALKAKRLMVILDAFDDAQIPVHLVYRPQRLPRPHVIRFVDFAVAALRSRMTELKAAWPG